MVQITEMTYDEKVKMYMKCKRRELVEMIIESNNNIDRLLQHGKPKNPDKDGVTTITGSNMRLLTDYGC